MQGEGVLIGKRQIFIRFSRCNINCKYCDTQNSKDGEIGKEYSYEQLNDIIMDLMTPDFDSLEITGGEPLLSADYIHDFLEKYPYKAMLETNATLPDELEKVLDVIDIVSMDIKLPEHFNTNDGWNQVYDNELKSIQLMEKVHQNYYIKIVVSPTTPLKIIKKIRSDLEKVASSNVEIIIQPVSPMELWDKKEVLFNISEIIGKSFPVSVIPQIHKYLDVE
ncbi:7-carboxy-7-deazaguanine synthase QueE [Methanosphaera sp.]|uniref:7-carboxy-7-deazaguanine synthase QueE n=1 Tax=Methanosphaera sp. TaxID=2666342 RepID=UPI003D8ECEF4